MDHVKNLKQKCARFSYIFGLKVNVYDVLFKKNEHQERTRKAAKMEPLRFFVEMHILLASSLSSWLVREHNESIQRILKESRADLYIDELIRNDEGISAFYMPEYIYLIENYVRMMMDSGNLYICKKCNKKVLAKNAIMDCCGRPEYEPSARLVDGIAEKYSGEMIILEDQLNEEMEEMLMKYPLAFNPELVF